MVYIIGQLRWKLQGLCYVASKFHERWSTNGLNLTGDLPILRQFFILFFIARLHTLRSANGTQQNKFN